MSRGTLAVMDDRPIQTVEEYVQLEGFSNHKHEFYDGQIWAMGGGTPEHARLPMALAFQLSSQLAGKPCTVYSSDLRVRVSATGLITYPDLSVFCQQPTPDFEDDLAQLNPTVLIEVTSRSSERYDRGAKFNHYKLIGTLREYVVVSHREHVLEVHRRASDGTWSLAERGVDGERVTLTSIGCVIDVAAVYARPGALPG